MSASKPPQGRSPTLRSSVHNQDLVSNSVRFCGPDEAFRDCRTTFGEGQRANLLFALSTKAHSFPCCRLSGRRSTYPKLSHQSFLEPLFLALYFLRHKPRTTSHEEALERLAQLSLEGKL